LIAFLDNVDYREATREHIKAWMTSLLDAGRSYSDRHDHLSKVSAMFAVADARETLPHGNPCTKIPIIGEPTNVPTEHKMFTVAELTAMLKAASSVGLRGWGAKNHEAAAWAFKLFCFTMARPVEITGLRKADIKRDGDSILLHIQSQKKGKPFRRVALHRDIAETFYTWAMARKSEEIFDCFRYDDRKKRTIWFSDNFHFLRDAAGVKPCIDGAKHERTLYNLRATAMSMLEQHVSAGRVTQRIADYLSHGAKGVKGKKYVHHPAADLQAAVDLLKPFAD
jgi:integrase